LALSVIGRLNVHAAVDEDGFAGDLRAPSMSQQMVSADLGPRVILQRTMPA